jgi:hypothetical protein
MREIGALMYWVWLYKQRQSVSRLSELPSHSFTDAGNFMRRHGRDASAQVSAQDGKCFVARGSEPFAK